MAPLKLKGLPLVAVGRGGWVVARSQAVRKDSGLYPKGPEKLLKNIVYFRHCECGDSMLFLSCSR